MYTLIFMWFGSLTIHRKWRFKHSEGSCLPILSQGHPAIHSRHLQLQYYCMRMSVLW